MIAADFVLRNAGVLVTLAGDAPRRGAGQRELAARDHAALAARDGRIVWVGDDADAGSSVAPAPSAVVLDARGSAVVPGFVDAHTHLAFAGDRDDEIRRRLAGATYREIAESGGGIVRSVEATRAAPVELLAALIASRLDEMLLAGTTTAEVKSGYGLSTESELRSLEAIRAAAARHPVTLVPTFMGAHEVPVEYRADRERYLALLVEEMIPEVARRGLAVFADVFCERGVFTVEESRRILAAAARARPEAPHPRRRARRHGRCDPRGRAGRALGRPPGVRLRRGHGGDGAGRYGRHPAAVRRLLSPPAAFRARP